MSEEELRGTFESEGLVEFEWDVLSLLPVVEGKEPITVNVFGSTWTIKELSSRELESLRGFSCDGFCDYDEEVVYIASDITIHRKGVVLAHELLHALFDFVGFEDDSKTEALVHRLEHGLFDLVNSFPVEYKRCRR